MPAAPSAAPAHRGTMRRNSLRFVIAVCVRQQLALDAGVRLRRDHHAQSVQWILTIPGIGGFELGQNLAYDCFFNDGVHRPNGIPLQCRDSGFSTPAVRRTAVKSSRFTLRSKPHFVRRQIAPCNIKINFRLLAFTYRSGGAIHDVTTVADSSRYRRYARLARSDEPVSVIHNGVGQLRTFTSVRPRKTHARLPHGVPVFLGDAHELRSRSLAREVSRVEHWRIFRHRGTQRTRQARCWRTPALPIFSAAPVSTTHLTGDAGVECAQSRRSAPSLGAHQQHSISNRRSTTVAAQLTAIFHPHGKQIYRSS